MLYQWYELGQASIVPSRTMAKAGELALTHPLHPYSQSETGRQAGAPFECATRAYESPAFDITSTRVDGVTIDVQARLITERPFWRLIEFKRNLEKARAEQDPNILIVAPLSGQHATLVSGAIEALLPMHNVRVTDFQYARDVPLAAGEFGLDDFIDDVRNQIEHFSGDVHVFAAVALMELVASPAVPKSAALAGSPIDSCINPTIVTTCTESHPIECHKQNVIMQVSRPHTGHGRSVYPGLLQHSGFSAMDPERHSAPSDQFRTMLAPDIARFVRSNDPAHEEPYDFGNFDCNAAKAAARGDGLMLDAENFNFNAANDTQTDPTVAHLKRAGLGLLGDPRHRAEPADYDILTQTTKFWRCAMQFVVDSLFGFEDSPQNSRSMVPTHRGHTPASSSVHRAGAGTVDADRQRQVRSKQQHVN
jgi:polyhydroxyalkanoate depolymerase